MSEGMEWNGIRFVVDQTLKNDEAYVVSFGVCMTCWGKKKINGKLCPECRGAGGVVKDFVRVGGDE